MDFFDKMSRSFQGHIFISHSHKDIDKVRVIRDSFEKIGFEPLCFYLKCLNDDSELEDLIEREIDAREWFLFVNSKNSRKSKWVKKERNYIEKTNRKKIVEVDLDDYKKIQKTLDDLRRNLRIFISHSRRDEKVAERIIRRLNEKDYQPFTFKNITDPNYIISDVIREASRDGCVMMLVSRDSMNSPYIESGLGCASDGNVIPVLLEKADITALPAPFRSFFSSRPCYCLGPDPSDEEIDDMIDWIGISIIRKIMASS